VSASHGPGLTFGVAAEAYERGRPEWPLGLLDAVPVPPGSEVLDLGAGTGKLTRLLATRHRVVAVEPDPAMRVLISGAEALPGTAEAIPLGDDSVDAVFAAEAFHWFDAPRALVEIVRVLRPRGFVVLVWNHAEPAEHVLPEGVLPELPGGHPRFADWRRAFDDGPFEPLREVRLPQEGSVSREIMLDFFASVSPVTSLPPEERRTALERIANALDRPTYHRRYAVVVHWTRLAT